MSGKRPPAAGGRRVLAVHNPAAGRRRRALFDAVTAALVRRGCALSLRETAGPGDAEIIAGEARRSEFDVLAVCGGDGTIMEAVNGLGPDAPPLAVVPMGTANVVALELGIGAQAEDIVRMIAEGVPREIDLGMVNGRRFLLAASAGLDSATVDRVDPGLKRMAGKGAYAWACFAEIARYRDPMFTVTADGETFRASTVIAANSRYYAGRFTVAPHARLDSGHLELCLLTRGGRWNAVRYAVALALGRLHRLPDVRYVAARRIGIDGPAGFPVQADGDVVTGTPARIELARERISVLSPVGISPDGSTA